MSNGRNAIEDEQAAGDYLQDRDFSQFARLNGLTLAQLRDLVDRIGTSRTVLEAAIRLLRTSAGTG